MKKTLLILIFSILISLVNVPCYAQGAENVDLDLLKALEIIDDEVYESKFNASVTRLEFAELFARAMKFNIDESGTQTNFEDVKTGSMSAGIVNAVYESGFMVGYGDGKFHPNENITATQAVKMAVDAVNYSFLAEKYGGWQEGYQRAAAEIGLTDGTTAANRNLTWNEAIKIIENMLTGPYVYFNEANPDGEYDKNNPVSLLTERHKVFKKTGIVTGNTNTRLTFTEGTQKGNIEIDDISYYTVDGLDADKYLGYNVDFYYRIDSGDKTVIGITANNKNTELLIESDEIADYSDYIYSFYEGSGTKKAKIAKTADIIYNHVAYLGDDESIYIPANGHLELIDNDSDGYFDVVKIINRRVVVISSYQENSDQIFDILNSSVPINADVNDSNVRINIKTLSGKDVALSELSLYDVAEVALSMDGTVVDILMSSESFTGVVQNVRTYEGHTYLTMDEKEYRVADEYINYISKTGFTLEPKLKGKFYLTAGGMIAFLDMSSSEKSGQYIYMIKSYIGENEELIIKALTTDNEIKRFTAIEKLQIDTNKKLKSDEAKTLLDTKLYDASGKMTPIVAYIELDADGLIKYIDTPKDVGEQDKNNTLRLSAEPVAYIWHVGAKNITSTMNCRDDTVVFVVPESHENADDTDYNAVPANNYFMHYSVYSGVKGYSRDKYSVFCDVVTHVGNAESGFVPDRKLFLVQEVDNVLDEDENVTYKISGLENGVPTEYMLKNESIINEVYKLGGGKTKSGVQRGDAVRLTLNNDKKIIKIDKIFSGSEGKSYMEYNPQYSNIPGNIIDGNVDELTAYLKSNGDFANAFRCFVGNVFYKTDGYVRLVNPIFNLHDSQVIKYIDSGEISLENFEVKNVFLYDGQRKGFFVPSSGDAISDFITANRASKVLVATNEYSVLCMVIFKQ